jgi:hypothetical protein
MQYRFHGVQTIFGEIDIEGEGLTELEIVKEIEQQYPELDDIRID